MNSNSATQNEFGSFSFFRKIWLKSVLLVGAGTASHFGFAPETDYNWVMRMVLLAAIPLVMIDRLAMLESARTREILGPRFKVFAVNSFGAYWASVMVLIMWPQSSNAAVTVSIWFAAATFVALSSAFKDKSQSPDWADKFLNLDRLQTGGWFARTSYIWWVPSSALLILLMVWTSGERPFSEDYILMQVFLLLAFVGFQPDKQPMLRSKFYWTRMVGIALFMLFTFGDYLGR